MFEYQIGQQVDGRQFIGRASENIIKLRFANDDESERIHFDDFYKMIDLKVAGNRFHKIYAGAEPVNVSKVFAAARDKFVAVAAGASKEIKDFHVVKIKVIGQDVEQAFFCKIRSWPGRPVFGRRVEFSSFEIAADYPHNFKLKRSKNL